MLFRKKIPSSCSYCVHATKEDDETIRCAKKGIRPCDSKCWLFRYDPTKRQPAKPKAMDFSQYDDKDYSL